ncbi:hypothetical protein P7C71_g4052, partial [Lecanoromycetidae sp. Uapishka_2]
MKGLAAAVLAFGVTSTAAQSVVVVTSSINTGGDCAPSSSGEPGGSSESLPPGTGGVTSLPGVVTSDGVPVETGVPDTGAPVTSPYGEYKFDGVYSIPSGGTLLNGPVATSTAMTVEYCATFCQGTGFYALYHGDTCNCGSAAPAEAPVATRRKAKRQSPPTIPCAGNPAEACGGFPDFANVFQMATGAESTAVVASAPVVVTSAEVVSTTDSAGSETLATVSSLVTITPTASITSLPVTTSQESPQSSVVCAQPCHAINNGSEFNSIDDGSKFNCIDDGSKFKSIDDGSKCHTIDDSSRYPACTGAAAYAASPPVETDAFGVTYNVECSSGVAGTLSDQYAHADNFYDCLEVCSIFDGCAGVSYTFPTSDLDKNCGVFTSATGFAYPQSGAIAAMPVNGQQTSAVGDQDLCNGTPSYNGLPFTDDFGKTYTIGCDQNTDGGAGGNTNLASTIFETLDECVTYCSTYDTCVGVVWIGSYTQGTGAQGAPDGNCFPFSAAGTVQTQVGNAYALLQ